MIPLLLKTRIVAARYTGVVVIALVVLGVVSIGAAGWVVTHPPTAEVTETHHEQTFRSDLGSSATVADGSFVWESGRTLEDKHVYLLSATPSVNLHSSVAVPADRPVAVTQRVSLVYRVKHNGQTVWQSKELLLADSTRVEDGTAASNVTLNATRIAGRISEIESAFSGVGTVSTHLRTDVTYRTDHYEGQINASEPITFNQRAIAIDEYPSAERTHAKTVPVTKQSSRNWPLVGVLVVVGVLSFLGARWVDTYGEQSVDVAAVEKQLERARYEEWVSRGTLPTDIGEYSVEMDSLDSLVNLAIDMNKRVVLDDAKSIYGVVDGDTVYYHIETDGEGSSPFEDQFEFVTSVDEPATSQDDETIAAR